MGTINAKVALLVGSLTQPITPQMFGAKGDGTTDDTAAFQAAIDAAVATSSSLFIPAPVGASGSYRISSTLNIPPSTAALAQTHLNITGEGYYTAIRWYGGNSTSVFKALGWRNSSISNVKIYIGTTATGVTAWDLDTSASRGSTSFLTFTDCDVNVGTGINNIGWRLGRVSAGTGDISFVNWNNCFVGGETSPAAAGTRGWIIEGGNTLNINWYGGGAYFVEKAYTNFSDAGASSPQGGGCAYFFGFGTSNCTTDFQIANNATHVISGGRFEVGKTFLTMPSGSGHPSVVVQGVEINSYAAPASLVNFDRPGTLIWDGCRLQNVTSVSVMFNLSGFTGIGSAFFRGGAIQTTDPFFNTGTTWAVQVVDVGILDGSNQTTTRFVNRSGMLMPIQAATGSAPTYRKGGIYFDTTLNKMRIGGATAWETVTSV